MNYVEILKEKLEKFKQLLEEDSTMNLAADQFEIKCIGHAPGFEVERTWLFEIEEVEERVVDEMEKRANMIINKSSLF